MIRSKDELITFTNRDSVPLNSPSEEMSNLGDFPVTWGVKKYPLHAICFQQTRACHAILLRYIYPKIHYPAHKQNKK
jgi:hypothetical protein